METMLSILALAGMGFAAYKGWKWMMRSGIANARAAQPLTPHDLKVLEESAARLTADLRAAADDCVQRIAESVALAEKRLRELESVSRHVISGNTEISANSLGTFTNDSTFLQDSVMDDRPAHVIAREAGVPTGEVELLRGLSSISRPA